MSGLPPRPKLAFDIDKHRYSTQNHPMSGIIPPQWFNFLWNYREKIDWALYFPRILFLTFMSLVNGLFSLVEGLKHDPAADVRRLHEEPVFIIGHPRTGTTHIHNMLSLDDAFIFANTLNVGFPNTFMLMERFKSSLAPLMSETRPMDNMKLTWDLPQEDELATQILTSGLSPYNCLQFLRDYRDFFKYFTLEGASDKERKLWIESFLFFLKKVTYRYCGGKEGPAKPLLIKSPVHTARLKLLVQMFPKAKFIYMHRNPYEVFQSSCNMAQKFYGYCALQRPSSDDITDFICDQYELMWERYNEDRKLIPKGNLIEIGFADLEARPLETLQKIYRQFGWSQRFNGLRPRFVEYIRTLEDFKKNDHAPLPPDAVEYIKAAWRPSFTALGYPLEPPARGGEGAEAGAGAAGEKARLKGDGGEKAQQSKGKEKKKNK